MHTIPLAAKRSFSLYTSIKELPTDRYIQYLNYWEAAAPEATPQEDETPNVWAARLEASNKLLRLLHTTGGVGMEFLMEDELATPAEMSFATLVGAVDNREVNELTEAALRDLVALLRAAGLPRQIMEEQAQSMSKRFTAELFIYLPAFYGPTTNEQFTYQQLQRRLNEDCAFELDEEAPALLTPERIKHALLDVVQPASAGWEKASTTRARRERTFGLLWPMLVKQGHQDGRQLPVFDFASNLLTIAGCSPPTR